MGCKNVTAEGRGLIQQHRQALIVNSSGCGVRDLALAGNEAGVRMLWTAGCEVVGCRAEECTIGFLVQGGEGDVILGSAAWSSSDAGFNVQGSTGWR